MSALAYSARVAEQIKQYQKEGSIRHKLSEPHNYLWNQFLANRFAEIFSVNNHIQFYVEPFAKVIKRTGNRNLVSIGSGECDLEIQMANGLMQSGITDFKFHCIELSPLLVERAERRVREAGHEQHFTFLNTDIAEWQPTEIFSGYMAHHSLHHIVALEHLFSVARASLENGGYFVTCDMIGRNGHMRWPEAKELLDRVWQILPENKRFHNFLNTTWENFINHDCSTEGFEGIGSQDILPLLIKYFNFEGFLAYGGLIDVFASVCFGPNFLMEDKWDCAFVDFIAYLNDVLIESGYLTPTVMFARLIVGEPEQRRFYKHLSPEFCVRRMPLAG